MRKIIKMRLHYFDQEHADPDDFLLKQAIRQGYVPETCLLNGKIVMDEIKKGRNPCWGCEGPREKCHGKPKKDVSFAGRIK